MISAMTDLNQISLWLLSWIGKALILGTVVAALTWLPAKILRRRLSPGFEVALWSVVLIKFLVPIGPNWSYSMPSVFERIYEFGPVQDAPLINNELALDESSRSASTGQGLAQSRILESSLTWANGLAIFYLSSVLILLAWRTRRYRLFRAKCRALPYANDRTRKLVEDVCRRLGVRRIPAIRISEDFPAPFILGFARPLLVLARRQTVRPDELETVVVHEVTHLRRWDPYLRCLQWIAGTFLYFWPVVAWVNRRIDLAREHACDQWALSHGKLSSGDYARCLLSAATSRFHRWSFRPECMAGRVSSIERRIDMILKSPSHPTRRPIWGLAALAFLLIWSGFVLTGAANAREESLVVVELNEDIINDHAKDIVTRISKYLSADVDKDGEISFEERNAFLVAVFLQDSESSLNSFSYAESLRGKELGIKEAYDVVRGLSYRKKVAEKSSAKIKAAEAENPSESQMKTLKAEYIQSELQAVQVVLDGQDGLLDGISAEPAPERVDGIWHKLNSTYKKDVHLKLTQKAHELKEKIAALEAAGETKKAEKLKKELGAIKTKLSEPVKTKKK